MSLRSLARPRTRRRRAAPDRTAVPRAEGRATEHAADVAAAEGRAAEDRARAEGGPDDRAQYACGCGFVWQADVTASVRCPVCGTAQAW